MKTFAPIVVILCGLITIVSGCKGRGVSKAEASGNPVACALLVADTLGKRSPDLLSDVALGFARAGECERAFRIADSLKEREWFQSRAYLASGKAALLGHIYAVCSRNGNQPLAEKAYSTALQVLARNATGNNLYEFWETYNSLLLNQAEQGNENEAIRLMAEHSVLISEEERDSILARQAQGWIDIAEKLDVAGNRAAAVRLAKKAVATAAEIKDADLRVLVLIKASKAHFGLGEHNQGRELLERALADASRSEESAYRDNSRLSVARAFSQAGDFKRTEEIIALMELEYQRSWAWRDLAVKMAETGNCWDALQVSEKISGIDDKAAAQKAVVTKYAELNELRKAIEICEQIKGFGNRADARIIIARKYAQMNDSPNSRKFLNLAIEDADKESSGPDDSKRDRLLQSAMILATIGDRDRALSIIKDIGQQEGSSGELTLTALAAADVGNYDLAIEISKLITKDTFIDHGGTTPKEFYKARVLVDSLLKHSQAKRKGLEQDKNVQQSVLKALGLNP